jgi:hypothetical protein
MKLKMVSEYFLFKPKDQDVLLYIKSKCQDDEALAKSSSRIIFDMLDKFKDEPYPKNPNFGLLEDKLKPVGVKKVKDYKDDK